MRIVHVIATLAARDGGPPRICVDMARASAGRGHAVTVHATDHGMTPEERAAFDREGPDGVTVKIHPAVAGGVWRFSPALARAVDRSVAEADVVHLHSLYLHHDFATWRACRRHGVPYLLRPHGSLDPYIWRRHRWRKCLVERLFMNRVVDDAAALHYTTEEEQHLAEPYVRGAAGVVVPNGVRFDDFADAPRTGRFRALFADADPLRVVLFLGRLNFKKGLDLLIPAFAETAARDPAARLLIAGPDDGEEAATRALVGRHGLAAKVRFAGTLRGDDVRAAYGDTDLFVLPSYSENFGNAVVEAMASGTPVLISDKVNIHREVAAAGAGTVIPCDAKALSEAMARMLDAPDTLAAMGRAARTAAEAYRWERVAETLDDAYLQVIGARRPDGAVDRA